MDELHSIHERMLAGISQHNIDIEGLFTQRTQAAMGRHVFGGFKQTDIFEFNMRDVPRTEYQMLFNGDKPGLFIL